ncbi:MAG: sialate O-acetylesterase [Candidatus Nealsonbacteria bacterium]|nr:sialate O-acetylesterase [Candidatus Nealsonbacteria bacterium]
MFRKGTLGAVFVCLFVLSSAAVSFAEIRLPAIFADNMVLQQGGEVPVWGWAEPGEMVAVTIAEQSVTAKADKDGRWQAKLANLKPGEPFEMVVTGAAGSKVTLKNLLAGEVWVCSGQSNMAWTLARAKDAETEIAAAKYPRIRLFQVKRAKADTPQSDCEGQWQECTPATATGFSAVAYFFGRHLHKELDTPVGLIDSTWGGTPAELWTRREVLDADETLKPLAARGSTLYNGMIAPLIPYAIRGAIWYQGESNCSRAFQYRALFPAMIANWRADWAQGDFPFGFVQLAPYRYGKLDPACCAELWEAQLMTLNSSPNTGMAVTTDIGNVKNIHPTNKQDVGRRLGLWALATVHDKELVYSGPIYKSMKIDGDKARLEFDHVGGGLISRDGQPLTHFTIAGADNKFHPATAEIDGATIVVGSDQVGKPTAVRFGWTDTAEPNLCNKEGLPASPFRTDDLPGVTQPKP